MLNLWWNSTSSRSRRAAKGTATWSQSSLPGARTTTSRTLGREHSGPL